MSGWEEVASALSLRLNFFIEDSNKNNQIKNSTQRYIIKKVSVSLGTSKGAKNFFTQADLLFFLSNVT